MRVQTDRLTGEPLLLGPEVAVKLTDTGVAILKKCDGKRSLADIAKSLAAEYDAPEDAILADAQEFLSRLTEKAYIRWQKP
jgi:pyrroloquinoline quinone biosynthesis protein D